MAFLIVFSLFLAKNGAFLIGSESFLILFSYSFPSSVCLATLYCLLLFCVSFTVYLSVFPSPLPFCLSAIRFVPLQWTNHCTRVNGSFHWSATIFPLEWNEWDLPYKKQYNLVIHKWLISTFHTDKQWTVCKMLLRRNKRTIHRESHPFCEWEMWQNTMRNTSNKYEKWPESCDILP